MKEIITSRQNPQIKSICALYDKKGRYRAGLFRFDGIKLFLDSLPYADIYRVVVRYPMTEAVEKGIGDAVAQGRISEEKLLFVSESVFEKITEESAPEGIITVAHFMTELHRRIDPEDMSIDFLEGHSLLLAESLRDTGNLGTVMRSCAALGIERLILTDDCADIYNPKTARSAMGAIFKMPTLTVRRGDMPRLIEALRARGRRVYAAALREDAKRIGDIELGRGDCFVIGNEGHGLSDTVIAACDSAAIIPMTEGSESLNAAAAAAICIWETIRASNK